jgi:transmembrane sensor
VPLIQIVAPINELAARWAVRVDSGSLAPDEQLELDAWLNADPRHRGAYVRARAHWVDLDRLATLHGPASPVPRMVEAHRSISRRELLAASVAASTIFGGGLSWLLFRRGPERYTSGIGEVRRIALEDGSTLSLNTATEVTVEFSRQQRNIRLIRGEALFEVAHDKLRPFVVVARDTAVRAVGTAFAVRLESNRPQVDVTVTEGVVEVADSVGAPVIIGAGSRAAEPKAKRVSANERVVIASARAPEISAIAPAEAERQLAWREGLVSFDGESLQTAVAEINRHNRRQIVVDDPVLAARPIIGVFRATDLEGFSAAAAAALKAKAVPDGDVIRLQAATAGTLN